MSESDRNARTPLFLFRLEDDPGMHAQAIAMTLSNWNSQPSTPSEKPIEWHGMNFTAKGNNETGRWTGSQYCKCQRGALGCHNQYNEDKSKITYTHDERSGAEPLFETTCGKICFRNKWFKPSTDSQT